MTPTQIILECLEEAALLRREREHDFAAQGATYAAQTHADSATVIEETIALLRERGEKVAEVLA
jgi:hypothetical protein